MSHNGVASLKKRFWIRPQYDVCFLLCFWWGLLFSRLPQHIVIMRSIRVSRKVQEHYSQKPKFSMQ